jgi:hypothetical protein
MNDTLSPARPLLLTSMTIPGVTLPDGPQAEQILRYGDADLIAIGRQAL